MEPLGAADSVLFLVLCGGLQIAFVAIARILSSQKKRTIDRMFSAGCLVMAAIVVASVAWSGMLIAPLMHLSNESSAVVALAWSSISMGYGWLTAERT